MSHPTAIPSNNSVKNINHLAVIFKINEILRFSAPQQYGLKKGLLQFPLPLLEFFLASGTC